MPSRSQEEKCCDCSRFYRSSPQRSALRHGQESEAAASSSFGSLGDIIAEMLATQAGIQMALLNLGSAVNFVKAARRRPSR
jgi:hypothetical protein